MPDWLNRLIAAEVANVVRVILKRHGVDETEAARVALEAGKDAATTACAVVPDDTPAPD